MRAGHRTYMEVHLGVMKAKLMEVDGVALDNALMSSRGVFFGCRPLQRICIQSLRPVQLEIFNALK